MIFPDTTSQATTYDVLGRSIAQTDQAGKTTRYGYDPLSGGWRSGDRHAEPDHTLYTYDEQGSNQVTQTDALGRTTRFAYDNMGRRVSRTLPLGGYRPPWLMTTPASSREEPTSTARPRATGTTRWAG